MAAQAATAMCERGFQNLFMLSGGQLMMYCGQVIAQVEALESVQCHTPPPPPRSEGDCAEVSRGDDNRHHPGVVPPVSQGDSGQEALHPQTGFHASR